MQSSRARSIAILALAALSAPAAPAMRMVEAAPPKAEPQRYWDGSNRRRAQWKNETNKRGRNR